MSEKILEWLGNGRVGESSKTIALTALGKMPDHPAYPHDPDDFSRCWYLLKFAPEAKRGLEKLGESGGAAWKALVPRWADIEREFLAGKAREDRGEKFGPACYDLMRSILKPVEA